VSEKQQFNGQIEGKRIVAKFGTKLLTDGKTQLSAEVMRDLVRQVAALSSAGAQVAIITSGAVAAGRDEIAPNSDSTGDALHRQVLAAIGQSRLVERYDTLLREHGLIAAQALLTRADLTDRGGYLNARNTLDGLLALPKVVPVINENDVVADEELRGGAFGENDGLSALVANLIDADLLILLSDVHGLYEVDPRHAPAAEPLAEVTDIGSALAFTGSAARTSADSADSGRGGMRAKLEAAELATRGGCDVVVAHGREPNALLRIARDEAVGTRFPARGSRQESRKRWLISGLASAGALVVDAGAVRALRDKGRSLLPAGILRADGNFRRGDIVEVQDPEGTRVAVGISHYDSDEIARIQGERSDHIAAILGYELGAEVIHRNNMAVL
jgi:glutamate 5-kinase